jgi:hypothetical protein
MLKQQSAAQRRPSAAALDTGKQAPVDTGGSFMGINAASQLGKF